MAGRGWRSVLRLTAAVALAAAPIVAAGPARGEPSREDRAAATALFDEGRKLVGAKKYAEACPKFEAAMRLDPGMGTLFNLSDCNEKIGRTASAWSGFRDVAAQAKAANLEEREKVARERAAALEGKLAKVRIVVPAELAQASMAITRDGSAVPSALVGTAIPLDPGPHTIRVAVEGREPWEAKITLPEGGGTIDVNVPVTAAAKGTDVPPAGTGSAGPGPASSGSAGPVATAPGTGPVATSSATAPPIASPTASPRPWQRPLGIAATVAGVLGLGAGIALGAVAKSQADGADCQPGTGPTDSCSAAGVKARADALALGDAGTIVGIAGSVVGAAGLALWIFAPSAPAAQPSQGKATRAAPVEVRVGASIQGIVATGRF